jgi:integrase
MASIKKITSGPSKGKYKARYRDDGGKERARHFKLEREAQAWLDTVTASQVRGDYVDPKRSRITVGAWSSEWMEGRVHLKPKTVAGYESLLRTQVLPRWKKVPLARVTNADVVKWVATMRRNGLSPSRTRQAHGLLSMMLGAAVRDRRLPSNPASEVDLPRHNDKERQYLTHDQLDELASAAGDYESAVLVLGYCGLRFGELAALRVRNLDFMRRRIRVSEGLTEVHGEHIFGTPKTHQARSVPVPPFLCDRLMEHVAGRAQGDFVFPAADGDALWNSNFGRNVWDPSCLAVGLGKIGLSKTKRRQYEGMTPHALRHTAASLAIAAGANIKVVQTMLGHKTATMTWDLYGHLFEDDLDAVGERLDAARNANLAVSARSQPTAEVVGLNSRGRRKTR